MSSNDELNRRLVDQYTEISRLAGGLAHEIKNPLLTIRMNMELLAEDFRDSDTPRDRRAMKKVELVQQECQRLQVLLDNFLQFSKAHRLNLQPSDLNAQVLRVLDFYRPKARQSGVEVADYLTGNLPTVLLDREAFHGALLNLVLNAEQAMPQGGQLVLRTYGTPDGVALDLIDTGCGMDDETRARVFDAFFSTKRGGSGLGLPTARKIIEGHGGQILLQSELGRGTQVTLQLPVPARLPADEGCWLTGACATFEDLMPPIKSLRRAESYCLNSCGWSASANCNPADRSSPRSTTPRWKARERWRSDRCTNRRSPTARRSSGSPPARSRG